MILYRVVLNLIYRCSRDDIQGILSRNNSNLQGHFIPRKCQEHLVALKREVQARQ